MPATTILLIDDDYETLAQTTAYLLRHSSLRCTVHSAMSSQAAVSSLDSFQPNGIVIDVSRPEFGAVDFLRDLRVGRRSVPPIIAIVENLAEVDVLELMRLGVREVLTRDMVSGEALIEAIRALFVLDDLQNRLTQAQIRENETARRLEEANRYTLFLAASGQRFAETLDYAEALELVSLLACPFLGDVCILDMYDEHVLYRRSITLAEHAYPGLDGALAYLAPSIDAALGVSHALRTGRSCFYGADVLRSVGRDDADIAELRRAGMKRITVVPLIAAGQTLGTVTFGSSEAESDHESLRVTTQEQFARIAAVALENSRVLASAQAARNQAEAAKRRLSFQSRVSTLLSRSLEWKTTLERLMKLFTLAICDTAELYLLGDDGDLRLFTLAASSPEVAEIVSGIRRRQPPSLQDEVGLGFVARTGRSKIYLEDIMRTIKSFALDDAQIERYRAWAPTSSIIVPFFVEGQVAGVLAAVRDRSGIVMGFDDLSLVEDVGRRLAAYLSNARLYEREHSIASALQTSLLPKRLPKFDQLRIASRYLAGSVGIDIGGDWYDVLDVSPQRIAVTIGDVVGRGVVSAATMGQLRNLLRAYAFEEVAPARTLERVNELLLRTGDERYATVVFMIYDVAAQTLTYACAGHPAPIVIDEYGMATALENPSGLPIGAWPGATYEERTVPFPPGSTLVLYTDGLVETRERDMYSGIQQLTKRLMHAETEPETLADELLSEFAPDSSDDTAILIVRSLANDENLRCRWTSMMVDPAVATSMRQECLTFLRTFTDDESGLFVASLVLGELLGNIARHAGGEGFVDLDWRGQYLHVSIGDRGRGFGQVTDSELQGDLFRESGRGIAIIRHYVRDLKFSARPGGGTLVDMVLEMRKASRTNALL
jgi:serine phosphatase RsbU (regulator of sigma subunit)/CheY-like chemotaxis protein/anti-sigma regulatory factor (Ser/Thr protein kinase)